MSKYPFKAIFHPTGLGLATLLSQSLLAHGWITSPPSRQELCARRLAPYDCGGLQWEPQSVESKKGSKLCSGGGDFEILDKNTEWPATQVQSEVSIHWTLTAAHRTSSWLYYVDGELYKTFDMKNTVPSPNIEHRLSGLSSGAHTILGVWNIADTANAFYNCVDVIVSDKGSGDSATVSKIEKGSD